MPPIPSAPIPGWRPRVVCYFQTYYQDDEYISLLPLITNPSGTTHVILAAVHINDDPDKLTLNDDHPDHPKYTQLWDEVLVLQDSNIKVLGMLGGAAKGSFARLDYSESRTDIPLARFNAYYAPLRSFIRTHNLDGIDLDIEEEMSLPGVVHLIDRLVADFGPSFLITLAPVATALIPSRPHLSGFNYFLLEAARGSSIAWYNTQFYNGWGSLESPAHYDAVISHGWKPEKVVAGMLTNPRSGGSGYVMLPDLARVLGYLIEKHPNFGGVMGWEYWESLPSPRDPWEWSFIMSLLIQMKQVRDLAVVVQMGRGLGRIRVQQ